MTEDEKVLTNEVATIFELPKLQPILIETKNKNLAVRIVRWVTSIRKWRLLEDWHYQLPDGTSVVIPKNFVFDGASIPRPLWMILSPTGLLFIPGLIHDFAYRYDYLWAVDSKGELCIYKEKAGQEYWDKIFNEVAVEVNGLKILDWIAWAMLAIFGRFSWKSNQKLNAPKIIPDSVPFPSETMDIKPTQTVSTDSPNEPTKAVKAKKPRKTPAKPAKKVVETATTSDSLQKPKKTTKPRKPRKTKKPTEVA